ncbi:hypothetical protein JCM8097_006106 [Rhodosporidiobolus ruineniae]
MSPQAARPGQLSPDYTAISLDTTVPSPADPPPHSSLPPKSHIRRRSTGFATPDVTIQLEAEDDDSYFREKRNDSAYSNGTVDDHDEESPLNGGPRGHLAWRDAGSGRGPAAGVAAPRRKGLRQCLALLAILVLAVLCWLGGLATGDAARHSVATGPRNMINVKKEPVSRQCNPYDQYGVLNVNTSVPSENMWQPIAAPDDCQPVDFLSLLYRAQSGDASVLSDLEFARNRTVVIFGDSVDRDHVEHFCQFVNGFHEMIGDDHELSPPYPEGQEVPPEGYQNYFTGERKWPNYHQSRPFVCHVHSLDFRVLNVFHYGFRGETDFIVHHPHFYPPASVEDRFDQIVVPLMSALSTKYGVSAVPSILSIAPGFWGLLRQSVEDQRLATEAIQAGEPAAEAEAKHNVWRTMSLESRRWNERRVTEILRHLAKGWKGARDEAGRRTPTILWRALHFIKETNKIPYNRLIALDQVGRSVVDRLVDEGRAAEKGAKTWKAWTKSVGAKYLGFAKEGENEALEGGLGSRLKVDEWGSLMLGQSLFFRDEVHPEPLPGSFLYGNMLFQQLKMKVLDEAEHVRMRREAD